MSEYDALYPPVLREALEGWYSYFPLGTVSLVVVKIGRQHFSMSNYPATVPGVDGEEFAFVFDDGYTITEECAQVIWADFCARIDLDLFDVKEAPPTKRYGFVHSSLWLRRGGVVKEADDGG